MLLHLFLLLYHIIGLTLGDTISPEEAEVNRREGQSATLTCKYHTGDDIVYLYWYRHHSDLQAPQFILWKGAKSRRDRQYIPDGRYESETSDTSTKLTINSLTLADTGLYYCALRQRTYDLGAYTLTFGMPIKLTVLPQDESPVPPTIFILTSLQPSVYPPKPADQFSPEVCLATDFRPKDGEMIMNVKQGSVTVNTSNAVLSTKTKTYYFVGFSNETIHSCELHGKSSNNEADDTCKSIYPEKAKVNFYLLVMNGVRVLFTKTLAFNTILTVRALLF